MTSSRAEGLEKKLEKGLQRTIEYFVGFQPEVWDREVYADPPWNARSVLVHLLSAERELLYLIQNVAGGGQGVTESFDIDAFNQAEQEIGPQVPPPELLALLTAARQQTLEWVKHLEDEQLDRIGRHPALGEITVEAMINAIWGHHLLHIREMRKQYSEGFIHNGGNG